MPSVRESRDRVRSAIRNSGFEFPPHRITVNLAPADVRKAGASFDLPIALGILAAQGVVERRHIADVVLLGELSLDGSIQPARGVLPIAAAARREGCRAILLPVANASEAAVVAGLRDLPGLDPQRRGARPERPGVVYRRPRPLPRAGRDPSRPTGPMSGRRARPAPRAPGAGDCLRPAATTCCSSARRARARR